jgi:predicted acylesterase/phospholipase RssA
MLKNIIFPGGGLKGWAYIGTIRALTELVDYSVIEQVIGTSIGSLFGLCYVLQIEWSYLLDFIINLDFKEMIDIDIDSILVTQSLLEGKKYQQLLKEVISTKVDPEITFLELRNISKILLTINAYNITKRKEEYFNYLLTPNVKVIDAVMASCTLPLVFPAYNINNDYYYDSFLINNCAYNIIEPLETMVFEISLYPEFSGSTGTTGTIGNNNNNNLYQLVQSLLANIQVSKDIKLDNYIITEIIQEKYNNDMANINQSKDDIFNIYMYGYLKSKERIFENFIALPPIPVPN